MNGEARQALTAAIGNPAELPAVIETRAAAQDLPYTSVQLANLSAQAIGAGDPLALGAVETALGTWERVFSCFEPAPMNDRRTAGITAALLAQVGRSLALRGECVFVIEVDAGQVALIPASSWDVRGPARPAAWVYRVDVIGPSGTETRLLPAAAVLHFRIGVDPRIPYRGRGPLQVAQATAGLAAGVERALADETRFSAGRIAALDSVADNADAYAARLADGGIIVASGPHPLAQQQTPGARFAPQRLGAEPPAALVDLRQQIKHGIYSMFGLAPSLYEAGGSGARRDVWQRVYATTFAPLSRQVADEIRAKLDAPAFQLRMSEARTPDLAQQARSTVLLATAVEKLVALGFTREAAAAAVGLDIEASGEAGA